MSSSFQIKKRSGRQSGCSVLYLSLCQSFWHNSDQEICNSMWGFLPLTGIWGQKNASCMRKGLSFFGKKFTITETPVQ